MQEEWQLQENRCLCCNQEQNDPTQAWNSFIPLPPRNLHQKVNESIKREKNRFFLDDVRVSLRWDSEDGSDEFVIQSNVNLAEAMRYRRNVMQIENTYRRNVEGEMHASHSLAIRCNGEDGSDLERRSVELVSNLDEHMGVAKSAVSAKGKAIFQFIKAGFVPADGKSWEKLEGVLDERLDILMESDPIEGQSKAPQMNMTEYEELEEIVSEFNRESLERLKKFKGNDGFDWGQYLLDPDFAKNDILYNDRPESKMECALTFDWNNDEQKQQLDVFRKQGPKPVPLWKTINDYESYDINNSRGFHL